MPCGLTYSAACWNGFSLTATSSTACGPSPSSVAAWTSLTTLSDLEKSMKLSAPSLLVISFFSSPASMAMIRSPMALAYWQAREPNPPPAPTMATVCPGRAPDSFKPLYTVIPAHRTGAMASRGTSLGILATCAALAMQYCWKVPSTVYPERRACAHRGSKPSWQN